MQPALEALANEWAVFNTSGTLRSSSPGMADVAVVQPETGYYCVDLPTALGDRRHAVVGTIEDHVTGLQVRTIAVNSTITDGVCSGAGATWDLYVQTAEVSAGGAIAYANSGFRLLVPAVP